MVKNPEPPGPPLEVPERRRTAPLPPAPVLVPPDSPFVLAVFIDFPPPPKGPSPPEPEWVSDVASLPPPPRPLRAPPLLNELFAAEAPALPPVSDNKAPKDVVPPLVA